MCVSFVGSFWGLKRRISLYALHSSALCILTFSDTTDSVCVCVMLAVPGSFDSFYELADLITDLELAASAVHVYELLIALQYK